MSMTPENQKVEDERYMRKCILLAESMLGMTSPRPAVGVLFIKHGQIIGEGVTQKNGLHAESHATKNLIDDPKDSLVYTNLEPCSHDRKDRVACAKLLIQQKVREVVIGTIDPFDGVNGKGMQMLKSVGILVRYGVLEDECRFVNRFFFHWVTKKSPYVVASVGISRDFKIAGGKNTRTKITGDEAMKRVMTLRHQCDAILVGVQTVLTDNPSLTDRSGLSRKDPLRIILDSELRSPLDSAVFSDNNVLVATTKNVDSKKINDFKKNRIDVKIFDDIDGQVNVQSVLKYLGEKNITSVMVEGGKRVFDTFMKYHLISEWQIFQSKFIIGAKGVDVCTDLEALRKILSNGKKNILGDDTLTIQQIQ